MTSTLTNFNPASLKSKESTCALLRPLLLSGIEFRSQLKQAHWNLRDANFIAFHRFIDELAGDADIANDSIAERVRQLGDCVDAGTGAVFAGTHLPRFPGGLVTTSQVCDATCGLISHLSSDMHRAIDAMQSESRDVVTADLLTQIVRKLEVSLWFLESHLPVE